MENKIVDHCKRMRYNKYSVSICINISIGGFGI